MRFGLLVVLMAAVLSGGACGKKRAISPGSGDLDAAVDLDAAAGSDLRIVDDRAPAPDVGFAADAGVPDGAAAPDAGAEAGACPANAQPVDTCGCGCCGTGSPGLTSCYYPALGQSPASFPDPRPPNCATAGCSVGERHVCCADPPTPHGDFDEYCAYDPATDLPRIVLKQTEATRCATVTLVRLPGANPQTTTIPGWSFESGRLGDCADLASGLAAIGALGTASLVYTGQVGMFTAHLVLFTANATPSGTADAHRLDVINLPLSTSACP